MRLAIIGAGPAGLATARAALAHGLEPVVFERAPVLGGVWRPGTGAAWPGMTTNLSHHLCSFSEHLWPDGSPDFPHQGQVHDYLTAYATGLTPRYGCAVTEVAPAGDGWSVSWREESGEYSEYFPAAVLATGVFSRPWTPPVGGAFAGESRHALTYREPGEFLGRRVAVVGMSFSGSEIAAELAEAGVEVTGVTGRPFWLLPRYQDGVPRDLCAFTRERHHQRTRLPVAEANRATARRYHDLGANPGRYHPRLALDPDSAAPPHAVISDRVPAALAAGALRLAAGHVARLVPGGLELTDGGTVPCEVVIWATGHRPELPLPTPLLDTVGSSDDWLQPVLLHGCTFHPDLPGLAFVGVYRGPFFAVVELQARWAVAVLSGALPAPSEGEMRAGIEGEIAIQRARPRPQFPHGDYVGFADRLAAELGVLPEIEGELWHGPVLAAHYRLTGPGANPGLAARQIRSAGERRGAVRRPAR